MPNNHSKYRIPGGLRAGRPVSLDGDHGRPGVHPPASLGGEPLDFQAGAGEEFRDGRGRGRGLDAGEDDLPLRRL
jgi:hypothetical protein